MSKASLSRRTAVVGTLLAPFAARAFGDASRFIPAVVKHGGTWDSRSTGLRRLAWELQRRTSVEVLLEARPVELDNPALFQSPFLYLSADSELPPFSAAQLEGLRRYLTFGGFLFAESTEGVAGGAAERSLRRELARALPQSPLAELPRTHVIFKSFYLLDGVTGRVLNAPAFEAAVVNRRAAAVLSTNDVMGALCRDDGGAWLHDCVPGGERQREIAIRNAINVAMYALCLDYKDDAVHVPQILKRRR